MFPSCSLRVPEPCSLVFPPCSRVPTVFPPCSLDSVPSCSLVFPRVPTVFPPCSLSPPSLVFPVNPPPYRRGGVHVNGRSERNVLEARRIVSSVRYVAAGSFACRYGFALTKLVDANGRPSVSDRVSVT